MVTIFAAHDAEGATRFVGEVARGAGCGCFCIVCRSPLVAKQGFELEWHFAHEAGNERPECHAGATNLLRRLAFEELQLLKPWPIPPFAHPHPSPGRPPLSWSATPAGAMIGAEATGADDPAGYVGLSEGGTASVYVCIGREQLPMPDPESASVLVWCPAAEGHAIRTEQDARDFLRSQMQLRWLSLPDFAGVLASAREVAAQDAARVKEQLESLQRARTAEAGARWAMKRRAMFGAQADPLSHQPDAHAPAVAPLPPTPAGGTAPEWAPGLLPGGSIHYRALDDGSQWVCYQIEKGQWRLRQVPEVTDGWDETYPPTIALPDLEAGWLNVVDFGKLLLLFNRHARASHIDSSPAVIANQIKWS